MCQKNKTMKRVYLDANVILRLFTKEPLHMSEKAREVFFAAQQGKMSLVLIPIIVAEVVWVLESYYHFPKGQISSILTDFLYSDGLEVVDLYVLIQALNLYREKNIDFADALLGATVLSQGAGFVCSFDADFDRISGITRFRPEEINKE